MERYSIWHNSAVNARREAFNRLKAILGFENSEELQDWLESAAVDPYFEEFVRDYLRGNVGDTEPNFHSIMTIIGTEPITSLDYYTQTYPDKVEWTREEHFVRFMLQVKRFAEDNGGEWEGWEEEDVTTWGNQLYEVLLFLMRSWDILRM